MPDVIVTPTPIDASRLDGALEILATMDNLMSLNFASNIIRDAQRVSLVAPNVNRFFKRTVLELGRMVSVGQELEIVLEDNRQIALHGAKALMIELFGDQFAFVSESKSKVDPAAMSLVYTATSAARFSNAHTGWSFGVLANNTSAGYLADFIDSVVNACRYAGEENFEVLLFISDGAEYDFGSASSLVREFRTDWGAAPAISRKKNLLCEAAQYSDLAILHDRFLLGTEFCSAYDRAGYRFGLSVPRITMPDGRRSLDWGLISSSNYTWSRGGLLNYRDASPHVYCPGGFTVMRKSAWESFPWDESLSWNEHEDVELSRRFQRAGGVIEWVPAPVITLRDRWLDQNPLIPLDDQIELLPGPPVSEMSVKFVDVE